MRVRHDAVFGNILGELLMFRIARGLIGIVCGLAIASPASALAQGIGVAASQRGVNEVMRCIVSAKRHTPQRWPRLDDVASDLGRLYDSAKWVPLWSREGAPSSSARAVVQQLAAIETRGLEPEDYDAKALMSWMEPAQAARLRTPAGQAEFDVMLSTAALRALRALRLGRVAATTAHAKLVFPKESFDLVATVRGLTSAANAAQVFDDMEPPYLHYRLLKASLARYRTLAQDTTLLAFKVPAKMKPGATDSSMVPLRRLLIALGDLPAGAAPVVASEPLRYDSVMVSGMKHFQQRQGYAPDGVIGPATAARLRRPFPERVRQITLSLERWRWLPHRFEQPPVVVNVPAFRLHAFKSSSDREADLLSMDVVVGDSFDHKTPVFSDFMKYIVFSPYWDVPPSITRKEVLPKARKDAGYLARGNYEVVSNGGKVLGTSSSAVSAVAAGSARIRQKPGAHNSLGGAKFIFPNAFNVYLHDTPSQGAFDRARRDLSHGCIRLSEPERLAEFLLRDQPGWDAAKIKSAMSRTTPEQVNLTKPVPVYIVYATASTTEDGAARFYDDIYGHDRRLTQLLAQGYPYPTR